MISARTTKIIIDIAKASTCLISAYFLPGYSTITGTLAAAGYFVTNYTHLYKTIDLIDASPKKSADITTDLYKKADGEVSEIKSPEHRKICQDLYEFAKSHYHKKGVITFSYNDDPAQTDEKLPFLVLSSQKNTFKTAEYDLFTTIDHLSIHKDFVDSAIAFGGSAEKATELLKPLILQKVGMATQDTSFAETLHGVANFFLLGSCVFSPEFLIAPFIYLAAGQLLPCYYSKQEKMLADEFMLDASDDINYIDAFKFLNLFKQIDKQKVSPKIISIEKTTRYNLSIFVS